jgi:hypothetical protein
MARMYRAQDEGDVVLDAEVGEPVPGEHAFGADDQAGAEGFASAQQRLGPARQPLVKEDGAGLLEDAAVHRSGVQIDAGVESVLRGLNLIVDSLG